MKIGDNQKSLLTQYNMGDEVINARKNKGDKSRDTSIEKSPKPAGANRRKSVVRRSSIALSKKRRMSKRHSIVRTSQVRTEEEDEFEKMR